MPPPSWQTRCSQRVTIIALMLMGDENDLPKLDWIMAMHKLCVCGTAFYQSPFRQVRLPSGHFGKGTRNPSKGTRPLSIWMWTWSNLRFNVTTGEKTHTYMNHQWTTLKMKTKIHRLYHRMLSKMLFSSIGSTSLHTVHWVTTPPSLYS